MSEQRELMLLLLDEYRNKDSGNTTDAIELSAAEKFEKNLDAYGKGIARKCIDHFVAFCREFLNNHPPQVTVMSEGFGVDLAGGYTIHLVTPHPVEPANAMAMSPSISITGQSPTHGRSGYAESDAVPI